MSEQSKKDRQDEKEKKKTIASIVIDFFLNKKATYSIIHALNEPICIATFRKYNINSTQNKCAVANN